MQGWAEHLAKSNRVLHPIRKSWRYEQPDHGADAVREVGGKKKALKAKKYYKNAPMLKVRLIHIVTVCSTMHCMEKSFGICPVR